MSADDLCLFRIDRFFHILREPFGFHHKLVDRVMKPFNLFLGVCNRLLLVCYILVSDDNDFTDADALRCRNTF